MSSLTALDFFLLGCAILLLDRRTRRDDWPAQFLCLGAAIPAAFGLAALLVEAGCFSHQHGVANGGYVLGPDLWTAVFPGQTGPLADCLPDADTGARLLRVAVPSALLALSLIGWLISKPLLTEEHFTWIEVSALAILCSVMLASFIAWIAFIVDRGDVERQKLEVALHIEKEQIDGLLNRIEEPQSEANLRTKVSAGFGLAIVLTCLLSLLSWRMAQQSTDDRLGRPHARSVNRAGARTQTSGRCRIGRARFCFDRKRAIPRTLRNGKICRHPEPSNIARPGGRQRRTGTTIGYLREAGEQQDRSHSGSRELASGHRKASHQYPASADKQLMDEARATIAEMETAENLLLEQRTHSARAAARISISIVALGALLGVIFLSVAGATVSREITISARARAQVNSLNADLERRVAQRTAALGESEGRLAGVIQSATDSIITVDEEQRIVLFNSAAERVFRCPATDAMGQPINRFIPQPFHSAHEQHIRIFRDTDVTNRIMGPKDVLWAVRADGQEFQIEASISQVVTAGKKLFTVILRDVTEKVAGGLKRGNASPPLSSSPTTPLSARLSTEPLLPGITGPKRFLGIRRPKRSAKPCG